MGNTLQWKKMGETGSNRRRGSKTCNRDGDAYYEWGYTYGNRSISEVALVQPSTHGSFALGGADVGGLRVRQRSKAVSRGQFPVSAGGGAPSHDQRVQSDLAWQLVLLLLQHPLTIIIAPDHRLLLFGMPVKYGALSKAEDSKVMSIADSIKGIKPSTGHH